MGFIDFPSGREFFRLFWSGVFGGMKDMVAAIFDTIGWLLQALAKWFS